MSHFGETCRKLRENMHLSLAQVGERAGLNTDTVWRAEHMEEPRIRPTTFRKLAHGLGVTSQKLDRLWQASEGDAETDRSPGTVPLYDGIPASPPRYVGEMDEGQADHHISRDLIERSGITDPLAYTIVVRGDSMEPTMRDGDIVIVSPSAVHNVGVETGKVYAVWLVADGGATIKRVRVTPGKWQLIPDNPKHETIEVESEEISSMVLVAGKLTIFTELPPPVAVDSPNPVDSETSRQLNRGEGPLRSANQVLKYLGRLQRS